MVYRLLLVKQHSSSLACFPADVLDAVRRACHTAMAVVVAGCPCERVTCENDIYPSLGMSSGTLYGWYGSPNPGWFRLSLSLTISIASSSNKYICHQHSNTHHARSSTLSERTGRSPTTSIGSTVLYQRSYDDDTKMHARVFCISSKSIQCVHECFVSSIV